MHLTSHFVCSPLFPVVQDCLTIPDLTVGKATISFMMVPNIFPSFVKLRQRFSLENRAWFSVGLANLVVIDRPETNLAGEITEFLKKEAKYTAIETWHLYDSKINSITDAVVDFPSPAPPMHNVNLQLSEKLPTHLAFSVSEYIISVNKFLSASKRFTPHYYTQHLETIATSNYLVNDLAFLFEDTSVAPSQAVLETLRIQAAVSLEQLSDLQRAKRDELVKETHGRLVQFNSSMSYVYSQAYSGTFPLFDHNGIIRRHSLLGVGSAIGSLFELLAQLETAFSRLPFEELVATSYESAKINQQDFYKQFVMFWNHDREIWANDAVGQTVCRSTISISDETSKELGFFNRLAFFSGRLGFREYDFSATAAIQVLPESTSLEWHIINYTHEIIHNHVRTLLNQIFSIPHSTRKILESDEGELHKWLDGKITLLYQIINDVGLGHPPKPITYNEYFTLVLYHFCISSLNYGSLTIASNQDKVDNLLAARDHQSRYKAPTASELNSLIVDRYKDVTEIFVHILDYTYIYSRKTEIYVQSIWNSWATVTAVSLDLPQYILRTLLIYAINIDGKPPERFMESVQKFKLTLQKLKQRRRDLQLYERIEKIIDTNKQDLKHRFSNCILVADLVNHYFVGRLESILDANDDNRLPAVESSGEPLPNIYDVETNSFKGHEIRSKVRFALDQLIREINKSSPETDNESTERMSSWFLLSLSSL